MGNRLIVLITGANRGLGKALSAALLEEGHTVIMAGRDEGKIRSAALDISSEGKGTVFCLKMDVSSSESVIEAATLMSGKLPFLDIIVNNAAIIGSGNGVLDGSLQEINTVMETNLYGPMRVVREFMPLLRRSSSPQIINVSSGMGALSSGGAGHIAYRLSKTALNGLTVNLAAELGSKFKVNSVCPGWVKTDMGGPNAPRSLKQGIDGILKLVYNTAEGSGLFFRDGERIDW